MIDIDLLDQQLEEALTDELRSRLKSVAAPSRLGRPAFSPRAGDTDLDPWPAESDIWMIDDETWAGDPDPWPADPDIWAGGAEAWPQEPRPEPPAPRSKATSPVRATKPPAPPRPARPATPARPVNPARPAPAQANPAQAATRPARPATPARPVSPAPAQACPAQAPAQPARPAAPARPVSPARPASAQAIPAPPAAQRPRAATPRPAARPDAPPRRVRARPAPSPAQAEADPRATRPARSEAAGRPAPAPARPAPLKAEVRPARSAPARPATAPARQAASTPEARPPTRPATVEVKTGAFGPRRPAPPAGRAAPALEARPTPASTPQPAARPARRTKPARPVTPEAAFTPAPTPAPGPETEPVAPAPRSRRLPPAPRSGEAPQPKRRRSVPAPRQPEPAEIAAVAETPVAAEPPPPPAPEPEPTLRRASRRRAARHEATDRPAPSGWKPPSLMALPFEKESPAAGPPRPETTAKAVKPPKSEVIGANRAKAVPPAARAEAEAHLAARAEAEARPARPATRPEAEAAPSPAAHPHRARAVRLPAHNIDPGISEAGALLDIGGHAQKIVDLMAAGRMESADVHIAAHAELAQTEGSAADRRDAAAWATMRTILDGRQADARKGVELVRSLGHEAADPDADERYWQQRFWIVLEWGNEAERYDLLDHCRRRAYWQQDIGWRCMLVLLLARMGRTDEAAREFDETAPRVLNGRARDAVWLDMTTNLAEAMALIGDARRATTVNRAVDWPRAGMVLVGRAQVCKGSVARYHALLASTTIHWSDADTAFSVATDAHRRAGAGPLLARTLCEWGRSLTGRDDLRSRDCLQESSQLATQLQLVELIAGGLVHFAYRNDGPVDPNCI